ncbi:MAG: hypothetical protein ACFB50_15610 [Rubrobacteraceae bacterium]
MSRRRRGSKNHSRRRPRRTLPRSGYRDYLQRCEFSGREPEDFMSFLSYARRWRAEYEPAKKRGDFARMRELEGLLCV